MLLSWPTRSVLIFLPVFFVWQTVRWWISMKPPSPSQLYYFIFQSTLPHIYSCSWSSCIHIHQFFKSAVSCLESLSCWSLSSYCCAKAGAQFGQFVSPPQGWVHTHWKKFKEIKAMPSNTHRKGNIHALVLNCFVWKKL